MLSPFTKCYLKIVMEKLYKTHNTVQRKGQAKNKKINVKLTAKRKIINKENQLEKKDIPTMYVVYTAVTITKI